MIFDYSLAGLVTAEHIDVKEGTVGTVISGNTFDGRGMENNGARVVPMFEEVMFRLKDGEISQPVTTLFAKSGLARTASMTFCRSSGR